MQQTPKILHLDPLSLCSVPLVAYGGPIEFGPATGFFWRHEGRIFLISNWHVFSGRNPTNGQEIQDNQFMPDRITTYIHMREPSISADAVRPRNFTVHLWRRLPDGQPTAIWLQHPVHGQGIDVAAIEVGQWLPRVRRKNAICINDEYNNDEMVPHVGNDLFVIGFPLRPSASSPFPIWKRGSLATEYEISYRGKDCFLVDSSTKDGMSGSPVVHRSFISTNLEGTTSIGFRPKSKFLGVYSGREESTSKIDTQLGLVWKEKYIKDICLGNTPGLDKHFGTIGIDENSLR